MPATDSSGQPERPRRVLLGISGGSGSGKSTLASALAAGLRERLGTAACGVLAQDSYYIDQSARFDGDGGAVNFDDPASIDFALLARHLGELAAGRPVEVPIYDFSTHTRVPRTLRFEPRTVVIVEGTLLLSQSPVTAKLEPRIFVEAAESVRFARRLERDTVERGRLPEGVRRQFDLHVKPMHDRHVAPSRDRATLVVSGERQLAEALEASLGAVLSALPSREGS